jgi:hypothetical protein
MATNKSLFLNHINFILSTVFITFKVATKKQITIFNLYKQKRKNMKQSCTKYKDKNVYEILYKNKIYKIDEYFKPRNITPYDPLKHNQIVLSKWVKSETYPSGGYFWHVRAFDNTSQAKEYLKNENKVI